NSLPVQLYLMNNDTIFRYVLYKLNDIDLAIIYCNSAIKNNETNIIAICIRGKSYYLSNLFEEALEDFHKVLKIFPNKAILRCCGETYQKLKKYKKSLKDLDKIINSKMNVTNCYMD
ncbi:19899_t:CDS:1, partial [Gigaspora rosea]